MADITITIDNSKLDDFVSDLEELFPRESGENRQQFIKRVVLYQLRSLRRRGRENKAIKVVTVPEDVA